MSTSSPPPPPPPPAEVPLAPGFRFHPTDDELVSYYLRRRILGRRLRVDAIAEVDLYRLEPWDLPSLSRIRSRDAHWYFFARLDRKLAGAGAGGRGGPGNRTNRATPQGYWKTTGKDRQVYHRGSPVGMKKTLVFHSGRAPKGARTNWVMHEYRLLDAAQPPQDLYVVCRIFQKFGSGPQNGAQYGAPYMEEEWEEEDGDGDAVIQNGAAAGPSVKEPVTSDTAVEESNNEGDENGSSNTNEHAQAHEVLNPPEMAALQPQGSNETGDDDGAISLEEILSSTFSAENICGPEEQQNATEHNFSVTDFSECPVKDDGYVAQDGTVNWSDPSNGECTNWPLRAYSNHNPVNGTLSADELFDNTGNGSNEKAYSEQQQICQSDYQSLNSQADGFVAPCQGDDGMTFYDAPPNWVDGNDDLFLSDFLNEPLFEGDDLMDYFVDAPENDFKYDMLGSAEASDYKLTEMSNFTQKGDNKDKSGFDGISKTPPANDHYGASSSGSHGDLYPDTAVPVDGTAFGKRLVNMLDSIPAAPAMATEHPPATGKSVLSGVSPSSIRVTAGIIQLGGLTFTGSELSPLQKNGDFNLLLSFTMESDVTPKSTSFEPATRVGAIPIVMRSGLYLFFASAMILMLSYKIGSCIYSR